MLRRKKRSNQELISQGMRFYWKKRKKAEALAKSADTRSKVSKKPLRDPAHLARVRTKRCWSCFAAQGTEAHHIRECYPRTMGRRIGDDKTIPLCSPCHTALHRRSRTFWQSRDSVVSYAAALYVESLSLRGEANPKSPRGQR